MEQVLVQLFNRSVFFFLMGKVCCCVVDLILKVLYSILHFDFDFNALFLSLSLSLFLFHSIFGCRVTVCLPAMPLDDVL